MSKNIQHSLGSTGGKSEAYKYLVLSEEEKNFDVEKLKIYNLNRQLIENRLDEEQRQVINEIYYLNWFERKSKELMDKKQSKLEEERRKQEAVISAKNRQMMRNLKFNEWLKKKQMEAVKAQEKNLKTKNDKESEKKKCDKVQADRVWRQWLIKKANKEKEERLRKLNEEEERKREKDEKNKLSEQIFNEWLKKARNRPKPVRSNLGFASLSCTNIGYINPVPWRNVLDDPVDSNRTLTVLYKKPSRVGLNLETKSNSTVFDNDCNTLKRTAEWVRTTSQRTVTRSEMGRCSNTEIKSRSTKDAYKFGRNKSAPVFSQKSRETDLEKNENSPKKF